MFKLMIILFSSMWILAADQTYLQVSRPIITGIKNSAFISEQTLKLAQQTIWKNGKFHPLISNQVSNSKSQKLTLNIDRSKGLTKIDFNIITNEGQIISNAWAAGVEDRFILLQVRLSLYELFYGKQAIKESLNKLQNQVKNPETLAEKNEAAEANAKEIDTDLDKEIRTLIKAAGVNIDLSMKPFATSTSLSDSISLQDAIELINEKSLEQKKKTSKRADEFKINLNELRMSINIALKSNKQNEKKKENIKLSKEDEDKEINEDPLAILTKKDSPKEKEAEFNKTERIRASRTIFDLAYMNKNSESEYLITTKNNYNFFGFRYTYRKNMADNAGDDLVLSLHYLKSIGSKAQEYKVPSLINTYAQYLWAPKWLPVDLFAGIHYENQPFINLERLNEGLLAGENKILWWQLGLERIFEIKKRRLYVNLSHFKSLYTTSSFDFEKKFTASKTYAEIQYDVWSKLRLGIGGFTEEISSDFFKLTQNTFLISVAWVTILDE